MTTTYPLARRAARVSLATLALTCGTALLVRAIGAAGHVRRLLGFPFNPPARGPGEALDIAATNLRLVAAALIAALVVRVHPRRRLLFDVTLAALMWLNTAAIGLALGAYGFRLVEAVSPHALLELSGFALAGGAYLSARAGELTARAIAGAALLAVTLVAAGAVVETYVQIGGGL